VRARTGRDRPTTRSGSRGQATVELALALPVVVLVILLVVQVALVARAQVLVVQAARQGARAVAVGDDVGIAYDTPGLERTQMSVALSGGGSPGSLATVTVRYRAPTEVALVGGLLGDVTVKAEVTMRVEG